MQSQNLSYRQVLAFKGVWSGWRDSLRLSGLLVGKLAWLGYNLIVGLWPFWAAVNP